MKPFLEQINLQQKDATFYCYQFTIPFFEFKWHYHPEYELTFIIKGEGYRLVGDSCESFGPGDLVLLGSNLPHTWVGNAENGTLFEAVVIQFSPKFIESFLGFQESVALNDLMQRAQKGLFFHGHTETVKSKILRVVVVEGFERILCLLSLLHDLSSMPSITLSSNYFSFSNSIENEKRMNKVCNYVAQHFSAKIQLTTVAQLVALSETNFCKFFKKATGKTFSDYVNDIRIHESCQQLLKTDADINLIAMQCGFETLSYYNRVFLKKKGMTPKQFRKSNLH